MTINRDLLTLYKEWNYNVRLGNNGELCVKGSGLVQIEMYDDIVITFNVWYVLDLRKNLISIGILHKQGYGVSMEDGHIWVSKDGLIVMKGKLQHEIYVLMGSSVVGTLVTSQSLEQSNNYIELWHHRLDI